MQIMTIWNQIKNLFRRSDLSDTTSQPDGEATLTQEMLVDLMNRLEKTTEDAYCCDEVFALLDEYVELVVDDEQARQLMPLVQNHLDICSDCRDEYEVLLHVLKTAE
ncbi:MAG: hypothetical protein KC449_19645 [Anaerolineales bacterium]|nr:hypothetical protein [Anaerolineales bacterium]